MQHRQASKKRAGVTALFTGASGTGKSMAAKVLANELQLPLYRIKLTQVVSKYIGETEKNLERIFTAAEHQNAVLLFDEADALLGKRTEAKDSHDRYANQEVSYFFQRLEVCSGLIILTSSSNNNIEVALVRKLEYAIQFPTPSASIRKALQARGRTCSKGECG
jgi:SpoVK/Ycf46/Vps4 family AAA+-type ATPase